MRGIKSKMAYHQPPIDAYGPCFSQGDLDSVNQANGYVPNEGESICAGYIGRNTSNPRFLRLLTLIKDMGEGK